MEVETYNYRASFIGEVIRVLVLPPLFISVLLRISHLPLLQNNLLQGTLLVSSIPIAFALRSRYQYYRNCRDAERLGAQMIPVVQGKLPGSIDLLWTFSQIARSRYVGQPMQEFFTKTGSTTVNMRVLGVDQIMTINEATVKYVLATGFEKFSKGTIQKERMESFLGNGIFNRDGQIWRMHRAMTRPFFVKDRVSDFETFGKYTTETLSLLTVISNSAVPVVDVQDLFARFTLDAATEFLFGQCLHTLRGPLPVPGEATMGPKGSKAPDDAFGGFAQAFEEAQLICNQRFRSGPLWRMREFFWDKTVRPNKIIKEYLTPFVRDAVNRRNQNAKDGVETETTLLGHLVSSTDDVEMIRDELLNILLAGRDTTAALLSFTVYSLAMHPEVEKRLRKEIIHCCGTSEVTYEKVKEMKYLRAVLNEVLRLFPPVPGNVRHSGPEATTIPLSSSDKTTSEKPYYMPADTLIIYSALVMQRRKDLWGEDADEFDPDRWIDPERLAKYYVSNPFAFIPFNSGPRICLGQQFAYNEASFFLANLLPHFSFSLAPEYQPEGSLPPAEWKNLNGRERVEKIWPKTALTLYVVGGLWMKVTRLDN